jgi:hypothetical protein
MGLLRPKTLNWPDFKGLGVIQQDLLEMLSSLQVRDSSVPIDVLRNPPRIKITILGQCALKPFGEMFYGCNQNSGMVIVNLVPQPRLGRTDTFKLHNTVLLILK